MVLLVLIPIFIFICFKLIKAANIANTQASAVKSAPNDLLKQADNPNQITLKRYDFTRVLEVVEDFSHIKDYTVSVKFIPIENAILIGLIVRDDLVINSIEFKQNSDLSSLYEKYTIGQELIKYEYTPKSSLFNIKVKDINIGELSSSGDRGFVLSKEEFIGEMASSRTDVLNQLKAEIKGKYPSLSILNTSDGAAFFMVS